LKEVKVKEGKRGNAEVGSTLEVAIHYTRLNKHIAQWTKIK